MRRRVIVLLSALMCAGAVCAQEAEKVDWSVDFYRTTYDYWGGWGDGDATTSSLDIKHRQAKWYEFRKDDLIGEDTFNDARAFTPTLDNEVQLQHTHTYVDTIYMHKGSKTVLTLPTYKLDGQTNDLAVSHYQRWFDYRTDGSYRVETTTGATSSGTTHDLLVPGNAWYANNGTAYSTTADKVSANGAYRFHNGYVQIGKDADHAQDSPNNLYQMAFYYPTDDEYDNFSGDYGFIKSDNDYYAIACDMSIYNDTGSSYKVGGRAFGVAYDESDTQLNVQGDFYEPTLVGRVIFFIIGVEDDTEDEPLGFEHYFSLFNDTAYQGGGTEEGTKYLEEFNITCPASRLSTNTAECVVLTKDASAYAIPGGSSEDDHLTLTVAEDNAVIKLQDSQLSGDNRVIFYTAANNTGTLSGGKDSGTWTIDDDSTATILVTKVVDGTTYNIARYNLTFESDATALKYSEVINKKPGDTNYKRSKEYFASDPASIHHVDSLTFNRPSAGDASNVFAATSHSSTPDDPVEGFYAFPMDWQRTSYAFYDGCATGDIGEYVHADSYNNYSIYCRYCYYSLVNGYCGWSEAASTGAANGKAPETKPGTAATEDETYGITDYWMYIDASDRPGTVAEIPFSTPLCENSELLATAWIKSANCENDGSDDAAVLLTINGVTTTDDGIEQHIPIYRQYSGQIHLDPDDNQWYQIYFSFTINEELANIDYDSYTLKIENSCASTQGGDFYFDEVHVYTIVPGVSVDQLDPVCTSDENYALTRVNLNYESLMLKLGYDTTEEFDDDDYAVVDICVVNEYTYNNYLSTHDLDDESVYEDAVEASAVNFVIGKNETTGEDEMSKYLRYKFYLNYEKNTEYDTNNPGSNLAYSTDNNHDIDFFYARSSDTDAQLLSIDCTSEKLPYTPYVIIIKPHEMAENEPEVGVKYFAYSVDDPCSTTTVFFLSSYVKMFVNGEEYDPDLDICIGTTVQLQAQGAVTVKDGDEEIDDTTDIVQFDWFVGTAEEYTAAVYGTDNLFSVNDALLAFRAEYPEYSDLTDVTATETFTAEMLELLQELLSEGRLYLYTQTISPVMPAEGITVVAMPTPISNEYTEEYELFCVGYVPVVILASGSAPTLLPGFSDVAYPYDTFVPSVRAGLAQLQRATTHSDSDTDAIPLTINLRNASYVTDTTDHLGIATTEGYSELYLVSTTDPAYPSGDVLSYPMGKVTALYGNVDAAASDDEGIGSYVKVTFYGEDDESLVHKAFDPKEGYEYSFYVYFEEYTDTGEAIESNACQGNFQLTIKVVPEYVVWNENNDADTNWNTDAAWRRADNTDLHYSTDDYTSNETNTTANAYVPMLFTHAVMPQGTSVALYPAGFAIDADDNLYHWLDESTVAEEELTIDQPTNHIMYDMMVYGGELSNFSSKQLASRKKALGMYDETAYGNITSLTTQRYRTNLCYELHLAQDATMLHSECLLTDKVWTDVALPQDTWTLVATPLKGVVAGDWYTTSSSGSQATLPLFTDIIYSAEDNDRYSPAVYQRSWETAGKIIASSESDREVPYYEFTGWTSAYNDAYVPYQPGEGYSIKGGYGTGSTDDLVFRFPKADESYTYANGDIAPYHGTGILLLSDIVDRTSVDKDVSVYSGDNLAVTLSSNDTGYYIIGNPFTAYLSMKEFMSANSQFSGYWVPASSYTGGPIAGNSPDNGSWQMNSDGYDDIYVKPYSAFFVQVTEGDDSHTVTFTPSMQTMSIGDEPTLLQFAIKASSAKGTSSASIAYSDFASDDYVSGEDVLLLSDITWSHSQPIVYSIAGNNAVTVNMVSGTRQIPIGVFATDDNEYTLTFVGTDKLNTPTLYDAELLTETPLTEDYTLTLSGSSHGRYFIHANGAPEGINNVVLLDDDITVYSPTPHTLVVAVAPSASSASGAGSGAEILSVEVYSLSGTCLAKATPSAPSCSFNNIPSGVAVIKTTTPNATTTKKLYVR